MLIVAKAQVSVEQLMSYASLMAILIPLTLLFLTMSSVNSKELESKSLDITLSEIAKEVEITYSLCSPQEITRELSLRIPDYVSDIHFDDNVVPGELYLVTTLKDGSQIVKKVAISTTPNNIYSFTLPQNKRGNLLLKVSCKYTGVYEIEVNG